MMERKMGPGNSRSTIWCVDTVCGRGGRGVRRLGGGQGGGGDLCGEQGFAGMLQNVCRTGRGAQQGAGVGWVGGIYRPYTPRMHKIRRM
jgi:hypothetical protein